MPALIECVMAELDDLLDKNNPDLDLPQGPVELAAHFDIDIDAVSAIEGSFERVDVGDNRKPHIDTVCNEDMFHTDGPSVYMYFDYMVVRGREDAHHVFFAFQPTV